MSINDMVDVSKLPQSVYDDIWAYYDNIPVPEKLTVEEALKAYLEWNGIIGYTDTICKIFQSAA